MYVPAIFREERAERLAELIRAHGFGTLVTLGSEGLEASHVPMLLEPGPPHGVLVGHLARANPQIRRVRADVEALAIFQGPSLYVSPSWYATKNAGGEVVPTWNYIAVHAYGTLEPIEDADALLGLVSRLTDSREAGRERPWSVSDAPPDFVRRMLGGIVGFRLSISRLEGKWKLGQNRPPEDQMSLARALAVEPGPEAAALARHLESVARAHPGSVGGPDTGE